MSDNTESMIPEVKKRRDALEILKRKNLELKETLRSITDEIDVGQLKYKMLKHHYRYLSAKNSRLEQDLTENIKKFDVECKAMKSELIEKQQLVAMLKKLLSMQIKSETRLDRTQLQVEKLNEKFSQNFQICKTTVSSKAESYCNKVNETAPQSSRMLKVVNYNLSSTRKNDNSTNPVKEHCHSYKMTEANRTFTIPQGGKPTIHRVQTEK